MQTMKIGKSVRARWVVIPSLLLWAGCAQYQAKPLSPEQTAAQFEARTLDEPGLRAFVEKNAKQKIAPWPPREWDLETLTLVALYYHPSLDVARAHWAVAQAGIRTAGQYPNPAASVAPQYTSNSPSGESPWVVAFSFEPVIETAGKRRYRIGEAQQTAESARLSLAAQAWQVRSHLRTALVDYTTARQRVALLQNVRDAQEQALKLLEARLAAGDIAATELTMPRVAYIRAQADLADARRQAADSRAALAQALGLPLRALEGREIKFEIRNPKFETSSNDRNPKSQTGPGPAPASGASNLGFVSDVEFRNSDLRRQALYRRADILAALADYAASQSALQLEIARQYPDIRLGPGYEFDQGLHKWGLSIATDFLPVFHRNQGPIAEAEARRAEAAARFEALQIQIVGEIDRAVTTVAASHEQLRQIDTLLETQRQHVQSVEALVKAGAADQYELRAAQLEVATTEVARLDAQVKVQQALGQLEDAMQYPLEALPSVEQKPRGIDRG
jgi:cobalt-zinc-cadmium efflux system outer membrane protein